MKATSPVLTALPGLRTVAQAAAQRVRRVVAGDIGPMSAQNLASVVELMPLALLTTAVTVVLFAASLWPRLGGPALGWWLAGETAMLVAVASRWFGARGRPMPADGVSPAVYRRVIVFATAFAAPWVVLAIRFVPHSNQADAALLLSYCLGVAMGGAVFLGRMTLPAISYVLSIVAGVVAACLMSPSISINAFAAYAGVLGMFLIAVVIASASLGRARDKTIMLLTESNAQLTESHRQIERMALQDPETKLPNRKAMLIELRERLADWRLGGRAPALVVFNLRSFRTLAATYGHNAGEALIAQEQRRLESLIFGDDLLARLDVDSFALVLDADCSTTELYERVQGVADALCQRAIVLGRTVHPSVSAGVALPSDGEDPAELSAEELLGRAEEATRVADCGSACAVTLYSPAIMHSAAEKNALERDLRMALAQDALSVFYQPKVSLADRRIIGAEALLRWRHPERGMQSPDRFLPLAEERGIIPAVSHFVHRRVLADLAGWREEGLAHGCIAINAHPVDLDTPGLLLGAFKRFAEAGFGPADVLLEITEDCVFSGEGAAANGMLDGIHALGYQLSLDDFGTGRASLTHLKRLPVSEIKIDREFVNGLGSEPGDEAIVCAALEVARRLRIRAIAEGVETVEQEKLLRDLGCDAAQGYRYARPVPAEEYAELVRAQAPLGQDAAA